MGNLREALTQLEAALALSDRLDDHSHDADLLGEIADTHADLGDFEQAAKVIMPIRMSRFLLKPMKVL